MIESMSTSFWSAMTSHAGECVCRLVVLGRRERKRSGVGILVCNSNTPGQLLSVGASTS